MQDEYEQIDAIRQRVAALEQSLARAKQESGGLVKTKGMLLDKARRIKEEMDTAVHERDLMNNKVKETKKSIDSTMVELSALKAKIAEKRRQLEELRRKFTGREEYLSKRLSDTEWRLVTEGVSAEEESAIVASIAELRRKLAPYEHANSILRELRSTRDQVAVLKDQLGSLLEEKKRSVEESHERHKSFLQLREERLNVLKEVGKIREEIAKKKARTEKEFMDLVSANAEIYLIEQKLRRARDEKKRERQRLEEAMKIKLVRAVAEKLKKGESLSWDEFKIYMERSTEAQ